MIVGALKLLGSSQRRAKRPWPSVLQRFRIVTTVDLAVATFKSETYRFLNADEIERWGRVVRSLGIQLN